MPPRKLALFARRKHIKTAAILILGTLGQSLALPTYSDKGDKGNDGKDWKDILKDSAKKAGFDFDAEKGKGFDINEILGNVKETAKKGLAGVMDGDAVEGARNTLQNIFEKGYPGQIGYGFMMGYSSGFCLKKASKLASFMVGGVFIMLQTLSYTGYLKIDYNKVQSDIEGFLDMNQDGAVDEKDAKAAFDKAKDVLSYQMPSGGGFTAGLLMGLRG